MSHGNLRIERVAPQVYLFSQDWRTWTVLTAIFTVPMALLLVAFVVIFAVKRGTKPLERLSGMAASGAALAVVLALYAQFAEHKKTKLDGAARQINISEVGLFGRLATERQERFERVRVLRVAYAASKGVRYWRLRLVFNDGGEVDLLEVVGGREAPGLLEFRDQLGKQMGLRVDPEIHGDFL